MVRTRNFLILLICWLLAMPVWATGKPRKSGPAKRSASAETTAKKAASKKTSSKKKSRRATAKRVRGQRGIQSERVREIQEALIRENYLDGQASGVWDTRTKEALVRLQGEQGWQTKRVPDSRALIKLGLGPSRASAEQSVLFGEGVQEPPAVQVSTPNEQ